MIDTIVLLLWSADGPTAKIFMHGRSQAVRLPKEFRFPGKEVRVTKVGDKVILEPLEKAPFDIEAWRAELIAARAGTFLPEGLPEDEAAARDDDISFDRANVLSRHECRHLRDQRAQGEDR
jgi:antitoxin VapB